MFFFKVHKSVEEALKVVDSEVDEAVVFLEYWG